MNRPELLVLDAQEVLAGLDHVRRYWAHEIGISNVPDEFRLRAATLLERVPSRGALVAGLVRLDLDDPPADRLDPVELDVAGRIARALIADGWLDLGGAPIEAVISSIEHSGAIRRLRPDPT